MAFKKLCVLTSAVITANLDSADYNTMTKQQIVKDVILKLNSIYAPLSSEDVGLILACIEHKYKSSADPKVRMLLDKFNRIAKFMCKQYGLNYINGSLRYALSTVTFSCYRPSHKLKIYEKFVQTFLHCGELKVCGDKRTIVFSGVIILSEIPEAYNHLRRRKLI